MIKQIASALALTLSLATQAAPANDAELATLKAEVKALEAKVKEQRAAVKAAKRDTAINKLNARKLKAKERLAVTDPEGVK